MAVAKDLSSTITLNDAVVMPLFGLGTYQLSSGKGKDAEVITTFALQNGYKMVDTAKFYRNEIDVGVGVTKSGLPRSDVFIVTKLWIDDHGYERCKSSFMESLQKLDCQYIDMYLMHGPLGGDILRTYDAMIDLKKQGLIRSVGVSNFGVQHLEGLRKAGRPTPSVNQIQVHPFLPNQEIVDYCQQHGITVMGYSPLAKGAKMDDARLQAIADSYGKSLAQLMIRWSVQKGYITIPKSSVKERIIENSQVFDWSISEEDMKLMETLPTYNCTWDPTTSNWDELA